MADEVRIRSAAEVAERAKALTRTLQQLMTDVQSSTGAPDGAKMEKLAQGLDVRGKLLRVGAIVPPRGPSTTP